MKRRLVLELKISEAKLEQFVTVFYVQLCIDKGMVNGRRQAVDSAYVKANASMDSIIRDEIMDDSKNFMDELSDNEEDKNQNSKAKHSKTGKANKDWTSPSDPDARLSRKRSKQSELN